MTTFVQGRTAKTSEAAVVVDPGLAVGTHRFQLVVVTDDGRKSAPDVLDIVVFSRLVIGPLRPQVLGVVSPLVTPIRVPARPRASKPRKSAKTRSET